MISELVDFRLNSSFFQLLLFFCSVSTLVSTINLLALYLFFYFAYYKNISFKFRKNIRAFILKTKNKLLTEMRTDLKST